MACSCAPWSGGNVSEITEHYTALWLVPIKAEVKHNPKGLHPFLISYDTVVLEGFNQIKADEIDIKSFGISGGSCGLQLELGSPQFVVLYKMHNDAYEVNLCAPQPPYVSLKKYLETGADTQIPDLDKCVSEAGELKTDIKECKLWESSYRNWRPYGNEDSRKYNEIWATRLDSNTAIRKKPWWKFNQQ